MSVFKFYCVQHMLTCIKHYYILFGNPQSKYDF